MTNDMILDLVKCVRDALTTFLDKHSPTAPVEPETPEFDPTEFISVDCPPGHETVLSYLAKYQPETLDCLMDVVKDTASDGLRLTHMAKRRKSTVYKVAAPIVVKGRINGDTVNAYPLHLLHEFYGYY